MRTGAPEKKKRLFAAVAVLFGVVIGLTAAEFIARVVMPQPLFSIRVDLKQFPRRQVKGVMLWTMPPPWYSDQDIEEAAQDSEAFTIVGLGDSIMWGSGVAHDDAYMAGLEQLLVSMTGKQVRVINLSQPAYNLQQQVTVLEEDGIAANPDLILVHAWEDDLNQYLVVGGVLYDNNTESNERILHSIPLPARANKFFIMRSRFYQLTSLHAARWRYQQNAGSVSRRQGRDMLKQLFRIASQQNARVLFVLSPVLDKGRVKRFSAEHNTQHYFSLITEQAAEHNADVLDLGKELEGIEGGEIGIDLCHFNKEGHRRVMGIIAHRIAEEFFGGVESGAE